MDEHSEIELLEEFGRRFRLVRNHHDLTQEAFDVDATTIRRIESGRTNPSYITLQRISIGFNMSLSQLLSEIEQVD